MTTRRGKQFNSMVFASNDTLQGGVARDDVILSPRDAAGYGLQRGDRVRLVNDLGSFDGVVRVMDIAEGCVQTYWPESNVLIPNL